MLPLKVVDAATLDDPLRSRLRPGAMLPDRDGHVRRLPRFFYEIESWAVARETMLASNFALWEFMNVDLREADSLRAFPRYIPCAVTLIAAHLQLLRNQVGVTHIAANGGYRSPSHELSRSASPHSWGTAVNIYRIGDEYLNEQAAIEKYNELAVRLLPAVWARPYGHGPGMVDDHVHLDFGYVTVVPEGMDEGTD